MASIKGFMLKQSGNNPVGKEGLSFSWSPPPNPHKDVMEVSETTALIVTQLHLHLPCNPWGSQPSVSLESPAHVVHRRTLWLSQAFI